MWEPSMKDFEYKKETLLRYRNSSYALSYKESYANQITLRNFRAKTIALREISGIKRFILKNHIAGIVLDAPCGTGKLAPIFNGREDIIIASILR